MFLRPAAAVAVTGMVLFAGVAQASAQACDRACLSGTLDRYLAAVLKHDPAAAPLATDFRYTENAIEVRPGDGIWKSATALGKVQRRYVDPVTGQAAYFGLLEEGRDGGIMTLRIKVEDRAITEGEVIIGRRAMGVYSPDGLIKNPPREGPAPAAARSSREEMLAAAQSYFEGVHRKDGTIIRAHAGCPRIENGVLLAGPGAQTFADCAAGMERNTQIAGVINRRFPVIDEEAGAVLGMAVFTRPPDARRPDGTPWLRNLLTEIFTIDNGRIRSIHAAMHYLDPDVPAPGW